MVTLPCPHCFRPVDPAPDLAGMIVACPYCGQQFALPEIAQPPGPPSAPAIGTRTRPVTKRTGDDTLNLLLGLFGSFLFIAGVFAPFARVPFAGNVDYFRNGSGDGVLVLVLGVAALILTLCRLRVLLLFPAVLGVAVIAYTLIDLQSKIAAAREQLRHELADNPFRELGDALVSSVTVDWGCFVLLLGAALLTAAALWPVRR